MSVQILQPGEMSLNELAVSANQEHRASQADALSAVQHAIAAGAHLRVARESCAPGEWTQWCEQRLEFSHATALLYIRISFFEDIVLEAGLTSISQAGRLLVGLPLPSDRRRLPKTVTERILELRQSGQSIRAIADTLGIGANSVLWAINPQSRKLANDRAAERRRRRALERQALHREQRDAMVNRALVKEGEAFNEAWLLVQRLDGLLGQARSEAQTKDKRLAINEAHALRDKMVETLVGALGIE